MECRKGTPGSQRRRFLCPSVPSGSSLGPYKAPHGLDRKSLLESSDGGGGREVLAFLGLLFVFGHDTLLAVVKHLEGLLAEPLGMLTSALQRGHGNPGRIR